MYKKIYKYFSAHPMVNSCTHILIGVGVGILITYPLVVTHPVRWGVTFLGLGIVGYVYAKIAS